MRAIAAEPAHPGVDEKSEREWFAAHVCRYCDLEDLSCKVPHVLLDCMDDQYCDWRRWMRLARSYRL